MNLVTELRHGPSYTLNSDEKHLRERAAEEIERLTAENNDLRAQVQGLNAALLRQRNA